MKLTAIIMLVSLMQVSAATFGQNLTLKEKNITYLKLFFELRKQTGYNVLVKSTEFRASGRLDADFRDATVDMVMKQITAGGNLEYLVEEKTIVIREKQRTILDKAIDYFSNIDVSGRIVDSEGRALPGASIMVKGSRTSATSGIDGSFSLKEIPEDALLLVSYVGYETREVKVGREMGAIILKVSNSPLDEVQVIAYATTTKRLNTGNTFTVSAKDIEKQPVQNPLLALQGRVPGLTIVQNTGVPGGGVTVRIQGLNSLQSGNDPLYVVDGVPISSQLPKTGLDDVLGNSGTLTVINSASVNSGNPLNYINPSDIESIDVLKDADATSIYGSRAANGAILITTKRGKAGKMKIDANFSTGVGDVERKLAMLDTRQYLDMRYEAYKNDNIDWRASSVSAIDLKTWDTTRYTNWQEELIGHTARFTSFSNTISGGSENTQYLVSTSYNKQTTVFPGEHGNRNIALHFSLSSRSANDKFRMQLSGNYLNSNIRLPKVDLTDRIFLEPNAPSPFNDDGTLNWAPSATGASTYTVNPYIPILQGYRNSTDNLIGNLILGYKILPGLEISASSGYTNSSTKDFTSIPTLTISPGVRATTPNSASYGNRNLTSWLVEPQLTFKRKVGKLAFDVLLGTTYLQNNATVAALNGQTYASDALLENYQSALTLTAGLSSISKYRYNAFFGRFGFNLGDQFIVNLTGRRDGSSRFGENNRFHNFGSIGASWIFTQQDFIKDKLPVVSFGKLRASYGTTGNDQISDYQYIGLYANPSTSVVQVPYQGGVSLQPTVLPNPNLQWESTRKLSLGLDLGFFKDRLLLSAGYSSNTSDNLLNPYLLPSVTGFTSVVKNFPGTVRNGTWEFLASGEPLKMGPLSWHTSLNLTIPRNTLVSFPGLETSAYKNTLVVGEPITVKRVLDFVGVDQVTGLYQFRKQQGGLTTSPVDADRTVLLNTEAKWYGGFQNQVNLGRFQLDFLVQFVKQLGPNLFYGNGTLISPGSFARGYSNQPISVLERWRPSGDITEVQKFGSQTSRNTNIDISNARFTDASYARLKNVSLSWQVPSAMLSKAGIANGRIFLQGQNLLTITNFRGLDPENRSNAVLPPLRVITAGIQIGF